MIISYHTQCDANHGFLSSFQIPIEAIGSDIDIAHNESDGEEARDGDDGNMSGWVLGSDCAQDNMAEGAVMGVLPETGETADQQTVDPGAK